MTTFALEQTVPVPGELVHNTEVLLERAEFALRAGADVVVLPELAASGYVVAPGLVTCTAQPCDGPLVGSLIDLAQRYDALLATGYCEDAGECFYNSVALVGPEGLLLNYRKLHLFDREKLVFAPGDELPVVETRHGTLGLCVCYDLRFVEVLRSLSLRGADVVLAPAAWTQGFDNEVPTTGIVPQAAAAVVQANLDQVAVVAVSQAGVHPDHEVTTLGGSLAVDAFGDVVAGPLSRVEQDSAQVQIDPTRGREARVRTERIRPREDRRLDVYGLRYRDDEW